MDRLIPGRVPWRTAFRLGFRNLLRNRKRTLLTALTVAIAVFLLQLMMGVMVGLERQSFDNLIRYQTGNAKIYHEGYFEERDELPLEPALSDAAAVASRVRQVAGVAAVTPRLTFSAQLSNGVDQIPIHGIGIQVTGSDDEVFSIPRAVIEGSYLRPGEEGMLLGSGLAELFEVSAGDWLTVLAKTRPGAYEALDLPIRGILGTGNPAIDQNAFLMPLAEAQRMLAMGGDVTELAVRFQTGYSERTSLRRLREQAPARTEVRGWREIESDFMDLTMAKRTGQGVFFIIFVILALVGVTNTMLMAAFERTSEMGMLMAMGMRSGSVRRLFLTEGALAGLLGGLLGTLLAFALLAWLAPKGIDLSALYGADISDMDIGYPVRDVIYPALMIGPMVFAWLATGAMAALATLYPAVRAGRLDPAEALRHV